MKAKQFFFKKKNQKTFDSSGPVALQHRGPRLTKVFCALFSKKRLFPFSSPHFPFDMKTKRSLPIMTKEIPL
jgi:hypothetical protein